MSHYVECWVRVAGDLFHQALAGEPDLVESQPDKIRADLGNAESGNFAGWFGSAVTVAGDEAGSFSVLLDGSILDVPLLGEGVEQKNSWAELLRETFEAACGELLAKTGKKCRVEKVEEQLQEFDDQASVVRTFQLRSDGRNWGVLVRARLGAAKPDIAEADKPELRATTADPPATNLSAGLGLLLDVELEASLRFGCREMPLGEILDLGPGDVVQLDRHVADPVDLIVGDKIVAKGEVVLVNGNFGLRISEVAAPRKRLESIRCLF
jgi:flagellar motor switch protein FliN